MMEKEINNFIQRNSPDSALNRTVQGGDFLQSLEWRKFQESVGRKTFSIIGEDFNASVIEHSLPVVGKYFYVPRGPVVSEQGAVNSERYKELINLAKKNKAGWIRIEPADEEQLEIYRNKVEINGNKLSLVKAPHDVQPREILVVDISKPEEQLLAEMKAKTRYNIKIAVKRGVEVKMSNFQCQISNEAPMSNDKISNGKYIDEFIRLTKVMARRQGIVSHPGSYYKKMLEVIPGDMIKLYLAEYEGKIIAANFVLFYGETCTYLHGASDDKFRNVMAPYLLQWTQIRDAKAAGCARYDFGGVKVNLSSGKSWAGVTRFKLGFSPATAPVVYPGSYDIIVSSVRYWGYRMMQRIKGILK